MTDDTALALVEQLKILNCKLAGLTGVLSERRHTPEFYTFEPSRVSDLSKFGVHDPMPGVFVTGKELGPTECRNLGGTGWSKQDTALTGQHGAD